MYDQDGLKENYIMWRTPIREGLKNIVKEKRKIITVASTFRNSELNDNSSSRTTISLRYTSVSMLARIPNPH